MWECFIFKYEGNGKVNKPIVITMAKGNLVILNFLKKITYQIKDLYQSIKDWKEEIVNEEIGGNKGKKQIFGIWEIKEINNIFIG